MFQPNIGKLGPMTIFTTNGFSLNFARTVVIKDKKYECGISVLVTKISEIKLSFVYLIFI